MIDFRTVWVLFLIPFAISLIVYINAHQKSVGIKFPSNKLLGSVNQTWRVRLRFIPKLLRYLAIILFFVALSGPRTVLEETVYTAEGIDIVLAIDASSSMAAEDFVINNKRVNRLAIVKKVVKEFIEQRQHDQLGLIAFSGLAYTVCPLTADNQWVAQNLERVNIGLIEDGTAVGSAIASSLSRLKTSKAKSKVVILLTDGVNNAGKVDPVSAAKAAEALGIKIYTIGAGTTGYVPYPVQYPGGRTRYQRVKIDLDERTLKEIADITGGQYFRATDAESLAKIYTQIDKLEKSIIEEFGYKEYKELFDRFLLLGLILLLSEYLLSYTIFLKIP